MNTLLIPPIVFVAAWIKLVQIYELQKEIPYTKHMVSKEVTWELLRSKPCGLKRKTRRVFKGTSKIVGPMPDPSYLSTCNISSSYKPIIAFSTNRDILPTWVYTGWKTKDVTRLFFTATYRLWYLSCNGPQNNRLRRLDRVGSIRRDSILGVYSITTKKIT